MADFAVCDNMFVDFDSHNDTDICELYKDFEIALEKLGGTTTTCREYRHEKISDYKVSEVSIMAGKIMRVTCQETLQAARGSGG